MNLIKQNPHQRYYQLNFKITRYPGGTIKDLFENDPLLFKDKYELAEDISESIDKICISDAHTHVERLVFPAFNVRDKKTREIFVTHSRHKIDGKYTILMVGGDPDTIYDDTVYIRHLRALNRPAEEKC